MREIRPSGSEGGVALTTPLLPLSSGCRCRIATVAFFRGYLAFTS